MERALGSPDRSVDDGGVVVRPAEDPTELRRARSVLDEAFRHHWMFEPWPFDEWHEHLRGTSASVLLALGGDEIAGVVTFYPTSGAGWIEELGVGDRWRRRGLGAALLRHAFAELAEQGQREARLNVDADNGAGATRLYQRVGMTVRREWRIYQKGFLEEGGRRGA